MNMFKNIVNLFSVMANKIVNNVPNYFFTIEDGELKDCKSGVIILEVPKGVKAIWSSALMYIQDTLVTAVIPEGIDCIRANTFEDCPNLLSVKLPKSLRSIETKAFAGCRSLRKINFPDGLKKVADDAFEDCPHVVVPERVKTMQNLAVGMASSFRHIPDKTRYIDDVLVQGGFDTPKNLMIPEGVRVIGMRSFAFFSGLKTVVVPEGVEAIVEGAFCLCDEMESIHLPSTLIEIGEDAFSCCGKLKEINFPDSIRYVGKGAFNKCRRLTLPQRIIDLMENPKPYFSEDEKALSTAVTQDIYTESVTITRQYTVEHRRSEINRGVKCETVYSHRNELCSLPDKS